MDMLAVAILVLVVVVGLVVLGVWLTRAIGRVGVDRLSLDHAVREEADRSRREAAEAARAAREELAAQLAAFRSELNAFRTDVNATLSAFGDQQAVRFSAAASAEDARARATREELARQGESLATKLHSRLADLAAELKTALAELRGTVSQQLSDIRADNEKRLEQMRATVDEKLQTTLNQRLGESFKLVSERLENVQKGLGQMQQLAADVGSLQKVMSNVKTRGTWGEVLLGNLLEQILAPEQYAANVAVTGNRERVEYAIKLPGRLDNDAPVYLPIDSKFPKEDYERLLAAQESGDSAAAADAAKALDAAIRRFADDISRKYIAPPTTTDFAIMFLPSEGLYAEVLRRTETVEHLRLKLKVLPTGPTTLAALLNSLQMGFRTLAIQKRSSEVWELLGAVKTEFTKYAALMAKVKRQLDSASNTIGETETRTNQINRKLQAVQQLSDDRAAAILPTPGTTDGDDVP